MEVRCQAEVAIPGARRGLSNRIHLHDSREINALRLSQSLPGPLVPPAG